MGHWYYIEPINLLRRDAKCEWVFAVYTETPSDNPERCWHHMLHFRNCDRTRFGVKVFDGLVHQDIVRRTAARIVQDQEYRDALLSNAPELPVWWKRR